jgi:hypothetical protein
MPSKKVKREVDKDFDALVARGYTPVENADKTSYKWVDKAGNEYKGNYTRTSGGMSVDEGPVGLLSPDRRFRRAMSQKVTHELPYKAKEIEKEQIKPPVPGKTEVKTESTAEKQENTFTQEDLARAQRIADFKLPTLTGNKDKLVEKPKTSEPTDEKLKLETVEDIAPIGKGGSDDPYIYVDQSEWQANNTAWQRFWGNKYGSSVGEIQAVRKGTTDSPDYATPKVPKIKEVDGKRYTLVANPDFVAPKQRVDVMMAQTLQSFLTPRSVGSLPGKAIAEGQAIRASAAGKKSAEAASNAAKTAEVAREKGTLVSKFNYTTAAKAAKSKAETAAQVAKRARSWGRLANSQAAGTAGDVAAGASKVGTVIDNTIPAVEPYSWTNFRSGRYIKRLFGPGTPGAVPHGSRKYGGRLIARKLK